MKVIQHDRQATLPVRTLALQTMLAIAGVGLLAASAWISVPFYPVPLTMQTLAVLLIGGLLGPRLGAATVVGYLSLGLAGAPVFHNGLAGPAVLAGPTGGYLLGFVPAAFLMGYAVKRAMARRSLVRQSVVLGAGAIVAEAAIYAVGLPWLAVFYTGGDLAHAAAVGAVPYLLGDLLKAAVAIGAIRAGVRYSRKGAR
jgi:biotin transport system substrate-specific component